MSDAPATLPDFGPFLGLRRHVTIAHHVPGRIRLKLGIAAVAKLPQADPAPFLDLLRRIRGIGLTRINRAALSVVVEYDPNVITPSTWSRLLEGDAAEVTEILVANVGR